MKLVNITRAERCYDIGTIGVTFSGFYAKLRNLEGKD